MLLNVGLLIFQVCIAFSLHRDDCVIPKSITPSRISENFKATDIRLDDEDMKRLMALGHQSTRYVHVSYSVKLMGLDHMHGGHCHTSTYCIDDCMYMYIVYFHTRPATCVQVGSSSQIKTFKAGHATVYIGSNQG